MIVALDLAGAAGDASARCGEHPGRVGALQRRFGSGEVTRKYDHWKSSSVMPSFINDPAVLATGPWRSASAR